MAPKQQKKAAPKKSKPTDDDDDNSSGSKLKVANQLKLRHILCEKQSKSLEALAKLQEGIAFNKVATEFSEDKQKDGGSLGWMQRSAMIGEFQSQVFEIPPSKVDKPIYRQIKTKFGYHIVMVEDRKM